MGGNEGWEIKGNGVKNGEKIWEMEDVRGGR